MLNELIPMILVALILLAVPATATEPAPLVRTMTDVAAGAV